MPVRFPSSLSRSALRLAVLAVLPVLSGCGSPAGVGDVTFDVSSVAVEGFSHGGEFSPTLDGPLRAVGVSPLGTAAGDRTPMHVTVSFSRPMVALGTEEVPPSGLLRIAPSVPGTLSWNGSRTLVFTPDAPLPTATRFTVTVASASAMDGMALETPVTFDFETPRPRVVRSTPNRSDHHWLADTPLSVRFSQAVDLAQAAGRFTLEDAENRAVPVTVVQVGDSTAQIRPRRSLSPGTRYTLSVSAGIPPVVGDLPTEHDWTTYFHTLDTPGLAGHEQQRAWWDDARGPYRPDRPVLVRFNTPIRQDTLAARIQVSPAVSWLGDLAEAEGPPVDVLYLPGPWKSETTYTVTFDPTWDAFDQPMAASNFQFTTGQLPPSFSVPTGVMFLEASAPRAVPVRTTGVAQVAARIQSLEPGDLFPVLRSYDTEHWYGSLPEGAVEPQIVAPDSVVTFPVTPGERLETGLQLSGGPGVYAFSIQVPETQGLPGRRYDGITVVSSMAITGKFSPHESLALVTDLASAQPLPEIDVEIRGADGTVHFTGKTSASGTVRFPGWHALGIEPASEWERPVLHAVARRGTEWTFVSSVFQDGIEPYRFGVPYQWYPDAAPTAGSIFSDRGLYRAGDTVHLKGIVRQRTSGDWHPLADSLRILVTDPLDETVLNRVVSPSGLGTFDLSWRSGAAVAQGVYQVRVARADDEGALTREPWQEGDIASGSFRVDAFRTATFAVEAGSVMPSYVAGDIFEGHIEGRYLFGAAMQNAPVRAELTQTNTTFAPAGFDGFTFGGLYGDGGYVHRQLVRLDTTLGPDGTLSRRIALAGHEDGQPTRLLWEASVQSPDGQEQAGRRTLTVHPALHYVGMKARTSFVDLSRDDWMEVDLVAVTPEGGAVDPVAIDVELIRREWNSVRELGWDGRTRWRSERNDVPVARQVVRPDRGRAARIGFRVPSAGFYILRASSQDIRGNTVQTESGIWASGRDYVGWERSDDDLLELVTDRKEYVPGQTARILIPSPFESATALITIERSGVMHHEVRTLTGGAPQIDIPITSAHLPNVFVGVVILTGRTAQPSAVGDPGAPGFRAGYAQLRVSPEERRLQLAMTASADTLRPGEEVTIQFQLRDATGKPTSGEIAFSAVDAGVVDLIGYRIPDPFDAFYGVRPLDVSTAEARANLVRQRNFGQKEEDEGGGGGDADFLLRKDFRAQAHWAPTIQTNARGQASITFDLPESLTTFRLMAAAVAPGNRFGRGQGTLVTTQPLVLQPAAPRFARVGDAWEAGVLVTNRTDRDGDVTLTADGSVAFSGTTSETVRVGAGQTVRVGFPASAGTDGTARLVYTGAMDQERDALELQIPVLTNLTRVRAGMFASTNAPVTEVLRFGDSPVESRSLTVGISSSALVGLDGAIGYLFEYPYGCLEQRTSRIRPLLLGSNMVETLGLTVLQGQGQTLIGDWLMDLDTFWTGTGYSLWPGGGYDHPYVTAFVLNTLALARQHGHDIPDAELSRVLESVERSVRNASDRPAFLPEAAWRDTRAFMLFALDSAGRYLETEVAALADLMVASPTPSIEGLTRLYQVLIRQNRLPERRQRIRDVVSSRIRIESEAAYAAAPLGGGYAWIFSSDTRASANALTMLSAAEENRELAELLVRGLLAERDAGHWATTQDNDAVVEALAAYRTAFESGSTDFSTRVLLAGQELISRSFQGPSLQTEDATVTGARLADDTDLDIALSGTGRLYYSAQTTQYVATPPAPISNGLRVSRSFQVLDRAANPVGPVLTSASPGLELETGQLVQVTLRLESATDRHYIVVDDPLPAGLEPVNTAFTSTSSDLGSLTGSGQWWGSFNHTELRDERVLLFADYLRRGEHTYRYVARVGVPGSYSWPGVQSEAMYQPSVRGRGAAGRLSVRTPD